MQIYMIILCAHQYQLKKTVKNKKNVVLLTTGSFDPFHKGHINMMNIAESYCTEKLDYNVIACYMSPSHDDYVSSKMKKYYKGNIGEKYNIKKRIDIMKKLINNNNRDNLLIDPWESTMNNGHLTFTKIIIRLKNFLNNFIDNHVDVIYVYGEDHIDFSKLFLKDYESICVQRNPGANKSYKVNDFTYFISCQENYGLSSTAIRDKKRVN